MAMSKSARKSRPARAPRTPRRVSIAQARDGLAALVRTAEAAGPVEITRRGEVVAVLLSARDHERSLRPGVDLWDAVQRLRDRVEREGILLSDDTFEGLRDRSPGREPPF